MNTGQVHTEDSQIMAPNYISQRFINEKPTRLCASHLHPTTGECTSCLGTHQLHVIKHILCSWGTQPCFQKCKHMTGYLKWSTAPAFPYVIYLWASEAYMLEASFFCRSLKHSDLNLKNNFSHRIEFLSSCHLVSTLQAEMSPRQEKMFWSWKGNTSENIKLEDKRYKPWSHLLGQVSP